MSKPNINLDAFLRKPYVAPTIEIEEYCVEEGFAGSQVLEGEEASFSQDENGDYELTGEWN